MPGAPKHWSVVEAFAIERRVLLRCMSPQFGLKLAEEQGAFLLKLRAAASLARLWRDQGKVQQARELLAPVYGWFTKGFDTLDLEEAKALLAELAQ